MKVEMLQLILEGQSRFTNSRIFLKKAMDLASVQVLVACFVTAFLERWHAHLFYSFHYLISQYH